MSKYEQSAVASIHEWKNPQIGWFGKTMEVINWPLEKASDFITSAPGIPPDIIALITLNQRAIGEYATYYGFDISSQQERLFSLNILGLASSPKAK